MNKKILTPALLGLMAVGIVFATWTLYQDKHKTVSQKLSSCRNASGNAAQKCSVPTSTVKLLAAQVPDRTTGWQAYRDDQYDLRFLHEPTLIVTVDPPLHDVILRRIRIGSVMILEAVSNGLAGNNPADYERLVYNAIAQNTKPDWTNYNPGYSSEKIGAVTLYRFHTNIFDMLPSLALTPTMSDGVPLQGVIFLPADGGVFLVYYQPKDSVLADDILRTFKVPQ